MHNKCTQLERDMDVVIGLWNQLVRCSGKRKQKALSVERERDGERSVSVTGNVTAQCLLTMSDAV